MGSAAAKILARDGAAVLLVGRTESSPEKAARRIRDEFPHGGTVRYFVGDAMDPAAMEEAVEIASQLTGELKICVTTVGGGTIAPLLLLDEEVFAKDLRRNIVSAFTAIKCCVPAMTSAGGGSIVCISSDAATMTWPFMASYCAGKAGLDALVRVAADELGSLGIRVNAVRPGLTRTDSNNVSLLFTDPELIAAFVEQKPLGRTGTPEDIAEGVRFLAGPESGWVTGQSLAIEGGNELRRAPSLEKVARLRLGDEAVDAALAGRRPT
jgi:NAD(P)-dependent dehydrogenase (short-subunit alcohol dehydrogenase family)